MTSDINKFGAVVFSLLLVFSSVGAVAFIGSQSVSAETTTDETGDSRHVVTYSTTGEIRMLNSSGGVIWNVSAPGDVRDVVEANGTVYASVTGTSGGIYAYNASDGTEEFYTDTGDSFSMDYSSGQDSVYAITNNNTLKIVEINLADNTVSWLYDSGINVDNTNINEQTQMALSFDSSSGADILASGGGTVFGVNADGTEQFIQSASVSNGIYEGRAADGNQLVISSSGSDDSVKVIDATGTVTNNFSVGEIGSPYLDFNASQDTVVISDPTTTVTNDFKAYDTTGTQLFATDGPGGEEAFIDEVTGDIRVPVADSSNDVYETYDNTGTLTGTLTADSGVQFAFAESVLVNPDNSASSSGDINGTVETQLNGNSVPNATVEVIAVNVSNTNKTADEVMEVVRGLNNTSDLKDNLGVEVLSQSELESKFESADGEYVYISDTDEWTQKDGIFESGANIGPPKNTLNAREHYYVFSVDSTKSNTVLPEDWLNSQLVGQTTDSNIVATQYAITGEPLNTQTVVTNEEAATDAVGAIFGLDLSGHSAGSLSLTPGLYKIHPEGSENAQWVIVGYDSYDEYVEEKTGDKLNETTPSVTNYPDENWTGINGSTLESSNQMQQALTDGTLEKVVVTTNENGEWSADVPSGYETVSIMAYKADGELMTQFDPANKSLSQMLETANEQEYNGTGYFPTKMEQRDLPTNDSVTVKVLEVPSIPENPSDSKNASELLDELETISEAVLNEDWESLKGIDNQFGSSFYEFYNDSTEDSKEQLDLAENKSQQLCKEFNLDQQSPQVLDCSNVGEDSIDRVFENINTQTPNMDSGTTETIIKEIEPDAPDYPEPEEIEYPEWWENGTVPDGEDAGNETLHLVNKSVNFETGYLDEVKSTLVMVSFGDGTTRVVSDEYYTVEESAVSDTSTVHIENYPIPESKQVAQFDVTVSGTQTVEQTVGNSSNNSTETVERAAKGHESFRVQVGENTPNVDSIDISTIAPSEGDSVRLSVYSEQEVIQMDNISAYSSSGAVINGTVNNGTGTLQVDNASAHLVRVEMSKPGENSVIETVRLNTVNDSLYMDAAVVLSDGLVGEYGIAADSTDRVTIEDSQVNVRLASSDGSSVVRIFEQRDADSTVNTIQLNNANGESISERKTVYYHTGQEDVAGLVRVNGKPLASDSQYFGKIMQTNSGAVIQTYTDTEGTAEISIENNPNILEKAVFRVESVWYSLAGPSNDFPLSF